MQPLGIALAIDRPPLEAAFMSFLEDQDPPFRVDGRTCKVVQLCASASELRNTLGRDDVEVAIVSATLNAMPHATVRDLAESGRPIVFVAPDPADRRWDGFGSPVIGTDLDAHALADAISHARRGRPLLRHRPQHSEQADVPDPARTETQSHESLAAGVVVVTSAYAGEGKTTIAAGLGFALGVATSTLIWDADARGSSLEFHLGADPARNACLLARRELDTPAAWDVALERELQSAGSPSSAALLCGVTKPSLRTLLSVAYLEQLIQALRERYRFVVVDASGAGWAPDDPELDRTILSTADRVLLVLRPDVQGIARARRVLRDWPHRDRLALVLNQAGLPGQERRAEVEVTLGIPVAAVLPADPRGVAAARVRHRPVVCQPGCRVAVPIVDLARRIAGGASIELPVDEDAASKRTWLQRLPVPVLGALR